MPRAQRLLQPSDVQLGLESRQAPLLAQRLGSRRSRRRLVHVGLIDLDIVEPDDRIELHRRVVGALAHHLPVDLAVRRHIDDEVAAILA